MEDFCQLQERLTEDKYNSSYEQCAKTIKQYSSFYPLDLTELFLRLVFGFLIGNSDMHLKNFSLIQNEEENYHLSPIYDQIAVNVVMLSDLDQTALTLNGKKRNIKRGDFLKFAEKAGIEKKTAEKLVDQMLKKVDRFLKECDNSFLPEQEKEKVKALIMDRAEALQKR